MNCSVCKGHLQDFSLSDCSSCNECMYRKYSEEEQIIPDTEEKPAQQ